MTNPSKTPEKQSTPATEKVVKLVHKLRPARLEVAEQARRHYSAAVDKGVTLEDCLKPEFWQHVGDKLSPTDWIEVQPDDGSWYALLLVRSADRISARVAVINYVELSSGGDDSNIGSVDMKVVWSGRYTKWRIESGIGNDKVIIKDGFHDEALAREHMSNEIRNG